MASSAEVNMGEQIRFWGALVGTEGLDEDINVTANNYIRRLTQAMKPFVDEYIEDAEDLIKQRKEDQERAGNVILEPTEGDFANLKILKD